MNPAIIEIACPGCRLKMPHSAKSTYDGNFNTSPECWGIFTEVIGEEFSNAFLFGRVHQVTVDTYAVQHCGGLHPDKSIDIHLAGLHLVLDRGFQPTEVPSQLQHLASVVDEWPHFSPPADAGPLTVFDVAMTTSLEEHIDMVRRWGRQVWDAWSAQHSDIIAFLYTCGLAVTPPHLSSSSR